MFDLNVRTLVHTVMASLPEIIKVDSGFIGGISAGQVARGAGRGAAYYAAAKAAVALFLKSFDRSGSSTKVGVVYPVGGVDTHEPQRHAEG
jgi:NADP-dependent 3-hydroxy acid dehydrogenase YdfG